MDLEKRLKRLEDRVAINDRIVEYFLAADGDDLDGVASSFTEDATFSSSGVVNARGRRDITAFITDARTQMGLTVHTPNYVLLTFDGDDHATGVVGTHLELVLAGESLFGAVRYHDDYVRQGGKWLIRSRDMRTVHIAPWADVGAAMTTSHPVRWPGMDPLPSDFPRKTGRA